MGIFSDLLDIFDGAPQNRWKPGLAYGKYHSDGGRGAWYLDGRDMKSDIWVTNDLAFDIEWWKANGYTKPKNYKEMTNEN